MADHLKSPDPTAAAVFSASLTLVAILTGVIGIFVGQARELERVGLKPFAADTRTLLNILVVFFMISSWSAFWSFLHILQFTSISHIYTWPIALGIIALFAFVPVWVWLM